MNEPITVLDHGYIRLVEDWGRGDAGEAEAGIVEAARQSTQGSFRGWDRDEKLLRTLYTSRPAHAGPFEFAGMVVEVQAPVFVFREWHRHRTQSYNEMSARYAPLPDMNYVPDWEVLKARGEAAEVTRNRQEAGTHPWDEVKARDWWEGLGVSHAVAQGKYERGLEAGVPKEIARIVVPVGRYSRMRAQANLRNWLAFLTLRYDPQAQWEIRQYAVAVAGIVADRFPRVWSLFDEGRVK